MTDPSKPITEGDIPESKGRSGSGRVLCKQRSFECDDEDGEKTGVLDTNSDSEDRKPEMVDGGEADVSCENEDTCQTGEKGKQ